MTNEEKTNLLCQVNNFSKQDINKILRHNFIFLNLGELTLEECRKVLEDNIANDYIASLPALSKKV